MDENRTSHVVIHGLVQGVSFRAWTQHQAELHGLRGWVRNRRDGSVEALVQGEAHSVEALVAWARGGPPGAQVTSLRCEPAQGEPACAAFELRPTA